MDNVHAIAQQAAPGARVVYVDMDEVAVLHSRAILAGNDRTIPGRPGTRSGSRPTAEQDASCEPRPCRHPPPGVRALRGRWAGAPAAAPGWLALAPAGSVQAAPRPGQERCMLTATRESAVT